MIALLGRDVCQSSTALWDCWTQPWCLWPANQRFGGLLSQLWRFLLPSGMIYRLSRPSFLLYLSPFLPQLGQLPSLSQFLAVWSCPLPSPSLDPCGQYPGPSVWANRCKDPLLTVHCQRPALGPGVGWWRPPGTLLPSHCPPTQHTGQF